MRKFKRRQRHSLPFGLLLAVMGALLLLAALAPRANAADFSWIGASPRRWNNTGNWSPGGSARPRRYRPLQRRIHHSAQSHHWCYCRHSAHDDRCHSKRHALWPRRTPQHQWPSVLLGTGILVDNTNAFTLTITANVSISNSQAWTNNSGNLFTVSGNVSLGGNALTVNGTGDTIISGVIGGCRFNLTKDGSGTLTLTGNNIYTGGTTVNGGTLLVNNTGPALAAEP